MKRTQTGLHRVDLFRKLLHPNRLERVLCSKRLIGLLQSLVVKDLSFQLLPQHYVVILDLIHLRSQVVDGIVKGLLLDAMLGHLLRDCPTDLLLRLSKENPILFKLECDLCLSELQIALDPPSN